ERKSAKRRAQRFERRQSFHPVGDAVAVRAEHDEIFGPSHCLSEMQGPNVMHLGESFADFSVAVSEVEPAGLTSERASRAKHLSLLLGGKPSVAFNAPVQPVDDPSLGSFDHFLFLAGVLKFELDAAPNLIRDR